MNLQNQTDVMIIRQLLKICKNAGPVYFDDNNSPVVIDNTLEYFRTITTRAAAALERINIELDKADKFVRKKQ